MRITLVLALAILGSQAGPGPVLEGAVPFDHGWTLIGEKTRVLPAERGGTLEVESGFAHRRELRLRDGTIDFDVRLTSRRSFVYVHFRAQSEGEREEFYLRPHKANLPDAVQYAPVWQNRSAWQLHHGPGGTAAVPFATDRWIHVRVVVRDRSAALFVDDMTVPALLVPRLSREPQAGYVSLGGFLPADVPGEGPIARFAHVQVRPDVFPFDIAAAVSRASKGTAPPTNRRVVTAWAVSRAYRSDAAAPPAQLPTADVMGEFTQVVAEPDGLVQLHRSVMVPSAERVSAAVARLQIRSARDAMVAFDLGFSDIVTVFVNGVPLFSGDASYSFDRPRREGLIGFDQARLYLPLKTGQNELAIAVTDSFGGWGLMGSFVNAPDLEVSAR